MKYECMILLPKDQYSTLIRPREDSAEKKDGSDSIYDLKDSKVTNVKVNDGGLVLLQSSPGEQKPASTPTSSSSSPPTRSSKPSEDGGRSGEGRVRGGPKGKKGKASAAAELAADDEGRAMMPVKHKYNPRGIRVVQQRASAPPTKDRKSPQLAEEDVKRTERQELSRRILAARRRLPFRRKRHLESDGSLFPLPPTPSDWSEDPKRRRVEEKMEIDRLIDMRLNQLQGLSSEGAAYTLNTREGHQPGPIARVVNPPLFVPRNFPTYDDPQMMVEKSVPSDPPVHRYEDVPMVDASYYQPEPLPTSESSDETPHPIPMDMEGEIDAGKEDSLVADEEIISSEVPTSLQKRPMEEDADEGEQVSQRRRPSEVPSRSQKRPLEEDEGEVEQVSRRRRPSKVPSRSQKRPLVEDGSEVEQVPRRRRPSEVPTRSQKRPLVEDESEVEEIPRRRRPHQLKALPPPDSAAPPPVRGKIGYQMSKDHPPRGEVEKSQKGKRRASKRLAVEDDFDDDGKNNKVKRVAPERAAADVDGVADEKKKVKEDPADGDDDEKKKKKAKRASTKKRENDDEEDVFQIFPGYSSYYKRARPDEDFAFGKRKRSIFSDGNRRPPKGHLSADIRNEEYSML